MTKDQIAPMTKISQLQNFSLNVTSDLSVFRRIDGNRPVNPLHVKRLAASIRKYGMLLNPILVNSEGEVIDGQHRLEAARITSSPIYYLIAPYYKLEQVHALNLNQKNWTLRQFMDGYASMGIESYVLLKSFSERHNCFTLSDCISMCSNISSSQNFTMGRLTKSGSVSRTSQVFNEGTWKTRDMNQAEDEANKIKMIKPYFKEGYNKSTFVGTMLYLLHEKKNEFDFLSFLGKLKLQPTALEKVSTREQCKLLIEEIYNYKRRTKISLRY